MVRISDARMSGTSYGACVLHVAPESHVGGPLAFVQDGDVIELDVAARRLTLAVPDEELDKRRADVAATRAAKYGRGYGALYLQHITQANEGCDFDFLEAGPPMPEPGDPLGPGMVVTDPLGRRPGRILPVSATAAARP